MNAPLPGPKAATRRIFALLRETNRRLDEAAVELEQLRDLEAIAMELVEAYREQSEALVGADMFPVLNGRTERGLRTLTAAVEGRR